MRRAALELFWDVFLEIVAIAAELLGAAPAAPDLIFEVGAAELRPAEAVMVDYWDPAPKPDEETVAVSRGEESRGLPNIKIYLYFDLMTKDDDRTAANEAIRAMPKVELHVHLEGAIRPETLLRLAARNKVDLPATDVAGLREWYRFTDFPHFVEVYLTICRCLRTPEDIELIARDFLAGQAAQNVLHSEVTFTALTHHANTGMPFDEQLDALNRARDWGRREHGVSMLMIIDIARDFTSAEDQLKVAVWVIEGHGNGVCALGLGGFEVGYPPEASRPAVDRAAEAGVPAVVHAGETAGAESVRGAVEALGAVRIGHGVRALEDPSLIEDLRKSQTMLEVCPSSNACLGVVERIEDHPLPRLMEAGLNVSVNSDDPPMFDTTLTRELELAHSVFDLSFDDLRRLQINAAQASLLPEAEKSDLIARLSA